MSKQNLLIVIAVVVSLLLVSTVAFAYITPRLGARNEIDHKDTMPVGKQTGSPSPNPSPNPSSNPSSNPDNSSSNTPTEKAPTQKTPTEKPIPKTLITPDSKPLSAILLTKGIASSIPNLKIVVNKTQHVLTLYSGANPLKSYGVAIGEGGLKDKQVSGDHKTPEGTFYIAEKSVLTPADQFLGTRWMRVSYPNIEDAGRGLNAGLIDQVAYKSIVSATNSGQIPPQKTALGGGVGIHGGNDTNGPKDWTWGCVGLNNSDVEEIYAYISVGTPLIILH